MSDERYDKALAVVVRAITDILLDRGADPGQVTPDRALYAFDDTTTDSLELDSLDALDLIAVVEDALGIEIPDEVDFQAMRTVGDVATMVQPLIPA